MNKELINWLRARLNRSLTMDEWHRFELIKLLKDLEEGKI